MTKANDAQTNIFSLFGLPDEVEEKRRKEEEARKKKQEEMAKRAEEAKKNGGTTSVSGGNKAKNEPFEVDLDTYIYHLGERIAITEYFTPEEIENGLVKKKKDEKTHEKITGNDVRKRLEKDYPDLVAAYTDMVWIKPKNMIMAVPKAKKKGLKQDVKSSAPAEGFMVSERIPFQILHDFITLSKSIYGNHGTELHGDIYFDLDKREFFLDIPHQVAFRETVERIEEPIVTAEKLMDIRFMKVMEIHSHHVWAPTPSSTDFMNERQPNMLYAIVGRINQLLPDITVRYFNKENQKHISIDPNMVFSNSFASPTNNYDLSVVEVPYHG